MGKTFNMVGGGGSQFHATINITNATANEVVTATISGTATSYSATASASGEASIDVYVSGSYVLTCNGKYSPSEISVLTQESVHFVRMLNVPISYQEVEWIQTSGTQHINLDLTFDDIYGFVFNGYIYDYAGHMLSFYNNSHNDVFYPVANGVGSQTSTTYEVWWGTSGGFSNLTYGSIGATRHSISYLGTTLKYDNSVVSSGITKPSYNYNAILFARTTGNGTTIDIKAKARLYSLVFYRAENVKNREMIPCYRKYDSVAGLYDVINDVFYDNDGTGTFTVGGDVT